MKTANKHDPLHHSSEYMPDTYIFRMGDAADVAYFIEAGAVEVSLPDEGGGKRVLGILGPGDVLGEMGPIDGHPRSADARTLVKTILMRIDQEQIEHRLKCSDPFVVSLFKTISKRLREIYGYQVEKNDEDQKKQEEYISEFKFEKRIREALERGDLVPAFQPIVSLQSGKEGHYPVVGLEALARWPEPDGTFIPPDKFIPLAEKSGLVRDIDIAMLKQGCKRFMELVKSPENYFVAFNLSASHFGNDNIVDVVRDLVKTYSMPPSSLKIEITESALIRHTNMANKVLLDLKEVGVQVALDDFGTGYSSLSYLHNYPIDVMKIDRSFVDNMQTRKGQSILEAMIALSLSLNMTVLAEGVETEEQCLSLREKRVHLAQGWHFYRPMPIDEALALLK